MEKIVMDLGFDDKDTTICCQFQDGLCNEKPIVCSPSTYKSPSMFTCML